MSWLFSQALVEEYLGDISLDGAQSAQSSGSHTQQAYCAPDKMTAFSRLSRFGMTFKPLTESRGEELLMSYQAAFHAKTSHPQGGGGRELQGQEAQCGNTWRGSFTKYDPSLYLWKTHQISLLGDLELFLETWPQWGLMRNGECWEQQTLAHHTKGTESGFSQITFPTPTASHMPSEGSIMQYRKLVDMGVLTKMEAEKMLEASLNPPRMKPWKPKLEQPLETKTGGYMNPAFQEWLMGWPLEWTDLRRSGTAKCLSVQQQRGEF